MITMNFCIDIAVRNSFSWTLELNGKRQSHPCISDIYRRRGKISNKGWGEHRHLFYNLTFYSDNNNYVILQDAFAHSDK